MENSKLAHTEVSQPSVCFCGLKRGLLLENRREKRLLVIFAFNTAKQNADISSFSEFCNVRNLFFFSIKYRPSCLAIACPFCSLEIKI